MAITYKDTAGRQENDRKTRNENPNQKPNWAYNLELFNTDRTELLMVQLGVRG